MASQGEDVRLSIPEGIIKMTDELILIVNDSLTILFLRLALNR